MEIARMGRAELVEALKASQERERVVTEERDRWIARMKLLEARIADVIPRLQGRFDKELGCRYGCDDGTIYSETFPPTNCPECNPVKL